MKALVRLLYQFSGWLHSSKQTAEPAVLKRRQGRWPPPQESHLAGRCQAALRPQQPYL